MVAGTAPLDYRDPSQFFSRTCFTRALEDHVGMVLRRLAGGTQNTSPVLTLVTQFGGGKTHTLTALYHLASAGARAGALPGVSGLLAAAGIPEAPDARVGVFVGNAWDPSEGRETPWIDLARQLAGAKGVVALGSTAATTPPGTESITRVFAAAEAPVLLLFEDLGDERIRRRVSKACADWCFERTARLPSEWMTVDSATTEAKARERLRRRYVCAWSRFG